MDEGRFPPGTVLGQRYRVVSLLGRGGMGEVYRANDLLLAQTVALKFLPVQLTSDESTLARFRNEVRIARQVSHPNVCRVYDIGEAEGSTYLSMEYVDGEDLASLLRRIGRLPPDKALEIARQLCAGLAAAHDKGVVHRDLKPGNIMLDGQGQLRITDFGLAGVAGEVKDIRSGTPAYLSPEQRSGQEVTARSDIYALGVVLHEVFTGKRPSADSTHPDLAPEVDRVIRRCLAEDPAKRPASALQVAAALPGGDPLAAALAAGETPSPEMVAAAGEHEGLRPLVAWALLAGVFVAVISAILLSAQTSLYRRVPLEKSPEALAESARNILRSVGYSEPAVDTAMGFYEGSAFLRYIAEHDKSKTRWDNLETGALVFWYRGSPRPLAVRSASFSSDSPISGFLWTDDPPLNVSGMTLVKLNPLGRLMQFLAVPPLVETSAGAAQSPDWAPLFSAAGLDPSKWPPAEPTWAPLIPTDARVAWTGSLDERPDIPMRIEAAAFRGKPVYFELIGPWTQAERMQPYQPTTGERVSLVLGIVLLLSMLVGGAMLARRNLRLGRGDRHGASRLAAVVLAAHAVLYLVMHHAPNFSEFLLFLEFLVLGLAWACFLWVLYIALEPYVRRRWPATLVSWSRLLAGGGTRRAGGLSFRGVCDHPYQTRVVRSPFAWRATGATTIGSAITVSGRAYGHCCHLGKTDRFAPCFAWVSVCPVSFPGLAAKTVGGSGRLRSFHLGLGCRGEPVSSLCLYGGPDSKCSDGVSDDPPWLAGGGGSFHFPIVFPGEFSPHHPRVGVVCEH
ncbi:MAG TPA: serine/threonine-protein kinase [Bryobacteraceae bacterium]|jgi:serine/threonine-protein kinase|nr:serine/threonine-protein kinase [Bryobacteraceae bacterium]